jgi:hypothetical protein
MHGDCASYRSKSKKDVHIDVGSDMTVVSAFAMMGYTFSACSLGTCAFWFGFEKFFSTFC